MANISTNCEKLIDTLVNVEKHFRTVVTTKTLTTSFAAVVPPNQLRVNLKVWCAVAPTQPIYWIITGNPITTESACPFSVNPTIDFSIDTELVLTQLGLSLRVHFGTQVVQIIETVFTG